MSMSTKNSPRWTDATLSFLYGTAWKEDLTEDCVLSALNAGFKAIDTANQRKHYNEPAVGAAVNRGYSELGLTREDLFLQSKFTYARGQDHRKPYDEKAPFREQVAQSFKSTLEHLHTDYLDSFLLHGPSSDNGLTETDWEVWQAMEELHGKRLAHNIGISNVNFAQLQELFDGAKVKPAFVQNRCFATSRWDKKIREFCLEHKVRYQGFSLLTANSQFLGGEVKRPTDRNIPQLVFSDGSETAPSRVQEIADQYGKHVQQVIFRFARQVGMLPITGTRSADHMALDLATDDFTLSPKQIEIIENIAL